MILEWFIPRVYPFEMQTTILVQYSKLIFSKPIFSKQYRFPPVYNKLFLIYNHDHDFSFWHLLAVQALLTNKYALNLNTISFEGLMYITYTTRV